MHPPPYDRALLDPTEPPLYARPPPSSSFDESDASGAYGCVNRISYPDFNSDIYDIGGVMTEPIPPAVPSRKPRRDPSVCRLSLTSMSSHTEPEIVETVRAVRTSNHSEQEKMKISDPVTLSNPFEPEPEPAVPRTVPFSRQNTEAALHHRELPPIPTLPNSTPVTTLAQRPTPPPRFSLLHKENCTIKTKPSPGLRRFKYFVMKYFEKIKKKFRQIHVPKNRRLKCAICLIVQQ